MQIVIDIPDTVWNKAMEYGHLDICGIELSEKVMNGIPLPKEHGRLKDIDKIITDGTSKGFCDWYDEMKYADTIIEAYKAESEDKE